jgi:oligopeptide transport system permease protein
VNTVFTDASGAEVSSRRFERLALPAETTLHVEQGSLVAEGDLLFDEFVSPKAGIVYLNEYELWIAGESHTDLQMTTNAILAPVAGTALVNRGAVDLAFVPVERVAIPEGSEVLVSNASDVTTETLLFGETRAPIAGEAYLADGEILIRPYESWLLGDGIVTVTTGQRVAAGERIIDFSPLNVYANMDGTVFINGDTITLSPLDIPRYPLPADGVLSVNEMQVVTQGTVLFGTTVVTLPENYEMPVNSQGDEIAPTFTVYVTDTEVLLLPQNSGYVPLRNYYPLGADDLGRDLWSRIAYGARVSLLVALIGPLVSFAVGLPYGLISGYFGGAIDNWLMRFVDLMYAFPTLLLIILLMAFFRSSAAATQPGSFIYVMGELDRSTGGMFFIFLGTGLTSWMGLARLARGLVFSVREQEYVVAARALGQTTPQLMIKHILPNILGPIVISETLSIPTYIRYEAFLSFIGLGVNPPTPSWGNMIAGGARVLRSYPHEAIFPALALFLIMFAFNFLGDGLRDALDPRLRGVD